MKFQLATPDQPYMAARWLAPGCEVSAWNYTFGQYRVIVSAEYDRDLLSLEPVLPQFCTYDTGRALGIVVELVLALSELPDSAGPHDVERVTLEVGDRHGGEDGGRVRLDREAKDVSR